MKAIEIQGKPYIEVNERVKEFRRIYPEGTIINHMLSRKEVHAKSCVA